MPVRIGELLLKEKRITQDQLQQALDHQKAAGGKLGFNLVKMGFVKDEEITALLSKQYRRPLDQPHAVRHRSGRHQADSRRDRAEVPDRPAQPRRRDLDDRDDGSDQRLRDGRHQVHDRLQRRAGRRLGDRGRRCDPEVLPRRRESGRAESRQGALGLAPERQHARDRHQGPRGAAGVARHRRERRRGARGARRRSAPTRWRGKARKRRSSAS